MITFLNMKDSSAMFQQKSSAVCLNAILGEWRNIYSDRPANE